MRTLLRLSCLLLPGVLSSCDGYADRLSGEFFAGATDPAPFPLPYRGVKAPTSPAGSGSITESAAFSKGNAANYFFFPFSPSQVATPGYTYAATDTALKTRANVTAVPASLAAVYAFDPPGPPRPFPAQQRCVAPPGYVFDNQRDAVRYDEQGSIFTALPSATFPAGALPNWSYVPLVQEVPVTSAGEPCQDIKSAVTLLSRRDVQVPRGTDGVTAQPDGNVLAWAVIDPGAAVYRVGQSSKNSTGVGPQRYGWYQRYLTAYLDGGYVPRDPANPKAFATQRLFVPKGKVTRGAASGTNPQPGQGFDVLEFPRGDPAYSPICKVQVYTPTDPNNLPTDAATIVATMAPADPPPPPPDAPVPSTTLPAYVLCLQVP